MTALVSTELLKLRTIRTTWVLLALAVALAALSVAVTVATATEMGLDLETAEGTRTLVAAGAPILVLFLGIVMTTGEFRHRTITSSLLATPERARVVLAKAAAAALAGLAFALVTLAVTFAIAVPWLAAEGLDVAWSGRDVWVPVLGVVVAATLEGPLGVGVGALLPNQVAALGAAIGWSFVVEPLLVQFLPSVGQWVPGGASAALQALPLDLLPMWGGGLLFAGYALLALVAGAAALRSRDIA